MDLARAEEFFDQAAVLASKGRHHEALPLLNELLSSFPDDQDLIYGKAMCLGRIGNISEALTLCECLVERYGDTKALDSSPERRHWSSPAFLDHRTLSLH
jgi:hypothetical protein